MARIATRGRLGLLLLVVLVGLAGTGLRRLLASPGCARVWYEVRSVFGPGPGGDLVLEVDSLAGVRLGDPVYAHDPARGARPLAHVAWLSAPGTPPRIGVRGAAGERLPPHARLHRLEPTRRLGESLAKAVPPADREAFAARLGERALAVWREALEPELGRRLPAFLARLDPERDPATRALLAGLGATLWARLDPLVGELTRAVRKALDDELGFLDRMGLLWKVATGDDKGLERKVLPVARAASERWWEENRGRVLEAVGGALAAHRADLLRWAGAQLAGAARAELLEPVLAQQRGRLEAEAEALLGEAADAFVRGPDGALRVRFAAVVRDALLGKRSALLLLEPREGP